ncbi:helix-turn-helix domain-containing protein [Actinospica robiniae]|uniref:helix-turn-helix domain-containing protein n=1 Tax=Actinospica robiniae TaxID=304901 RepID=UPI0012FB2CFE|nr:helix-turn-helix transcriptional regulator [Actinospica robiniae]
MREGHDPASLGHGWPVWGKAIDDALRERNISINAAADRVGVRNTTLRKWLDGQSPPRLDILPVLSQITGLSHAYQLSLGGILPPSLSADAHMAQVASELRTAAGKLDYLVAHAAELAFTDAGGRLAGILLAEGFDLQTTLRRANRGGKYPVHLSTYIGIDTYGASRSLAEDELRRIVTRIVGEASSSFGARWREQDAHDWEPPRPRLILNVPQHERPRPPAENRLSATPNILMLGCPYAHAEYIGALLADSLGYGYHDVRYSVPLPLDRLPADPIVTDARLRYTRSLLSDEQQTAKHVWSITDHRVIPHVISDLADSAIGCAVYVRSEDQLLRRGSSIWNIDLEEMIQLRTLLDDAVGMATWPVLTVVMPDALLRPEEGGDIDRDRIADVATLAAADVWRALAARGMVPRGNMALGSLRGLFDDRGKPTDLRSSLVASEQRMPPRLSNL